jgi:predicted lipid-binding transport protein (Tim44 family)
MLGGCANIQDDAMRTKTEGGLVGGVGGALVGGLLGFAAGGTRGAVIGLLGGAAVGAGVGVAVGSHIAAKKQEYASREDWLDACITQAQAVNEELVAANRELDGKIAALDKESAQLAAAYKSQRATRQQMQDKQKALDGQRQELSELIAAYENEVVEQKTVIADANANNNTREAEIIQAEIQKTEREIAKMKEYNAQLASVSARYAV